jgi:hypothetical protein
MEETINVLAGINTAVDRDDDNGTPMAKGETRMLAARKGTSDNIRSRKVDIVDDVWCFMVKEGGDGSLYYTISFCE